MFSPSPLRLEQSGGNPEKYLENSSESFHKWRPPIDQFSVPRRDISDMLN